jgi:hypothetical protein
MIRPKCWGLPCTWPRIFNRGRRGPRISTTTSPSGHRHIELHTPVRDKPKPIHSRCWKPEKPSCMLDRRCSSRSPADYRRSPFIILDVSHEIADNFDLIGIVIRDLDAGEFIFDQYHQLQTIEPTDAEIVTEVRFIYNQFGINTQILAN